MAILLIILILIALLAIYPVIRDYFQRKKILPVSYTEGLRAMLDGKIDEAIEYFKQSVQVDSNNIDAYLRLAFLYKKKGNTEMEEKIFERLALRRNMSPEDERKVYQELGKYYFETLRNQKAIAIYEELLNIDKNNITNYERLLTLYLRTKQWSVCEDLLKKLEKVCSNPEQIAQYYVTVAKTLFDEKPEDAAKYLKEALKHYRKNPEALVLLGKYYYQHQEIAEAIKIWNEFLSYYPERNSEIRKNLEEAYYDLNRYDEIIEVYQSLLRRSPDDISLYFALAKIYEKKEDILSAIKVLEEMPPKKLKEILPQVALARLYLLKGEPERARFYLDRVMDNY
jgi:lipopolysaccharide biosynthesis regulator YciM